jgi:hypothetical protein
MEKYDVLPSRSFIRQSAFVDFFVGLISIVVINLTSLFGAIILPFRNKPAFKWLLTTFIGLGQSEIEENGLRLSFILAVGTLLGTGIFHLIPMVNSIRSTNPIDRIRS